MDQLASCLLKGNLTLENVAIFVAVEQRGDLRPGVEIYLKALRQAGIQVCLIIQSDLWMESSRIESKFGLLADEVWARPNVGFDFGAWADVLLQLKRQERLPTKRLILVNDSVLGPFGRTAFCNLMRVVLTTDVDVAGLTDNRSPIHHVQSYFLSFSERVYASEPFWNFFRSVSNKGSIGEVVLEYEIGLSRTLISKGFTMGVAFPSLNEFDATVWHPSELIARGFPFVKRKVLRPEIVHALVAQMLSAG